MKKHPFFKSFVAMPIICLVILVSGQLNWIPTAKASTSATAYDIPSMKGGFNFGHPFGTAKLMYPDSRGTTISKSEVRKKLRFLFKHNKVRNGLIESLRNHPKASLDFFFSYEGIDEKGLQKASKEYADILASPMADLLSVAANQPEKAVEAFVKGAAKILASDVFINGFGRLGGINAETDSDQCELLRRNVEMKRKIALDANKAWYLCALDNGTDSEACNMLWENYRRAGEDWQDAVNDYVNAGCANQ